MSPELLGISLSALGIGLIVIGYATNPIPERTGISKDLVNEVERLIASGRRLAYATMGFAFAVSGSLVIWVL